MDPPTRPVPPRLEAEHEHAAGHPGLAPPQLRWAWAASMEPEGAGAAAAAGAGGAHALTAMPTAPISVRCETANAMRRESPLVRDVSSSSNSDRNHGMEI